MSGDNNETTIRRLVADDRARHDELVWELDRAHHAAHPALIRDPDDARIPEVEYLHRLSDPATFLVGAETEAGIVGFIRATLVDSPGGRAHLPVRYGRIEEIVVRADQRRGGIGRALLSAAREWAKANGERSLELSVYAFNAEAVAFYQREGFETKVVSLSKSIG
ncbi:MAG TPA: GNAT family N-acetyltransferase [Steroidobacteraceae bacterium]